MVYTIEKSPDYILSQDSAVRIKEAATVTGHNVTDLKFIVMLRNPVVRAVSEYIELQSHFVYETKKGFYCFKKVIGDPLICMNGAKGRPHPFVDEKIIEKLKHYFQPWNEKLYSI
ncbi:heparan sulfate glucosamine 3-O-sulfotransferase 6-like, partial [Gigantopelta aegis]|uniref:heparan sulfate glucosamine 3-O-sulfotransferase 6-like n=1 Tax=Gigantopelta aegis TaxID=1735272 RepID=UPI001B88B1AF